jgi:hypothetical protein
MRNIGQDDRPPLEVWKSLEYRLPGLAAMARDLLAIPMAGVGIERVFNYARDICHYRRGQLKPDTIRALMLIYCHQQSISRIDELRSTLSLTIDINTMTNEEIEAEVKERERECQLKAAEIDEWDQDQFISDTEENIPPRTRKIELQREFRARARRRGSNLGTLGIYDLNLPSSPHESDRRRQREEFDRTNWEVSSSEEPEMPSIHQLVERESPIDSTPQSLRDSNSLSQRKRRRL